MAEAKKSLFTAMKSVARLNKHMATAKKVVAVREFDGPDGNYTCKLSRVSHGTKEGVFYCVFEFNILDEGDHLGQKLTIFYQFKDTDWRTVEEIQDEFFCTLQLLGVDTSGSEADMDKQLDHMRVTQTPVTVKIKTAPNKKNPKAEGFKNVSVVGVGTAAEEVENTEYEEEESPIETDEVLEEVPESESVDEWEEVEEEPAEEPEEEPIEESEDDPEEAGYAPSDWIGYEMIHKKKSYLVESADDETGKTVIKDLKTGKKYNVKFADLTPPTE